LSTQAKPALPQIIDGKFWESEIDGEIFRFREAKLKERSQAANEARLVAPQEPAFEEQARILAFVTQRKLPDGRYEPLPLSEIQERSERFFAKLNNAYQLGLIALEAEIKKLSAQSKPETSQTQWSPK
jgi:hypothetical protein